MAGGTCWFPGRGRRNTDEKKVDEKKFNIRFFQFDTLRIATNNFSTLLGQGAYGSVFKGVLPDDGRTVAIKQYTKSQNGFLEMVKAMSHVRHINLIQVIGCCVDNGQQLLVCEFAENGSVSERLHSENAPAFDWETRAAVCLGTARGLSFLHHEISPQIIHRDTKPSNILLDANFVPKIADFDLIYFDGTCVYAEGEKQTMDPRDSNVTWELTRVIGTYGYLAPEYAIRGHLSVKADVYSFGIAMLEIITGRRVYDTYQQGIENEMILDWVTRLMKDGMFSKIVDPKLTDFPKEDVERFINVALLCTHQNPKQRPIMFDVVNMLNGRHISDQEISEMAARLIADPLAQRNQEISEMDHTWLGDQQRNSFSGTLLGLSSRSFTTTMEARNGRASIEIDFSAAMESREEEPVDDTSSGNSSSASALAPSETRLASSTQEDQSCPGDLMTAYFDRSMEKIIRYHVEARRHRNNINTITNQTTVIKNYYANTFKEAVYPPYLSGEFHRRPSHF